MLEIKSIRYNYTQEFKVYGVNTNKICILFLDYPTKAKYKYTNRRILEILDFARKEKYGKVIVFFLFPFVTSKGENLFRYGFSLAEGEPIEKRLKNTFKVNFNNVYVDTFGIDKNSRYYILIKKRISLINKLFFKLGFKNRLKI